MLLKVRIVLFFLLFFGLDSIVNNTPTNIRLSLTVILVIIQRLQSGITVVHLGSLSGSYNIYINVVFKSLTPLL